MNARAEGELNMPTYDAREGVAGAISSAFHPSQRAGSAAGQPISQLMSRALDNADLISLAAGFVDGDTLPTAAVQTAVTALLDDEQAARAALQYGSTPGFPPLREILRDRACSADGLGDSIGLDQVIVTAGSNQ
ncbi:MAG: hypothetical protein JJ992_15405, partial [Planctomycetes bacterium]|nr:hypothetical protein [Planctomycetota bacterium]